MTQVMFGSVCSGIEAASVAWHVLGWRAAWLAEIEPSPSKALHHHYGSGRPLNMPSPNEHGLSVKDKKARAAAIKAVASLPSTATGPRNLGDMTKISVMVRDGVITAPDILCGGTPCQAFSIAGLRNSLDDARGNLSLTFCEIADEIDKRRAADGLLPSVIVWENVPGVLNTKDNAFGCFLAGLAGEDDPLQPAGDGWTNAGCVFGPQRTVAWRVFDAQYFGVAQRRRRVFVVASAREGFDPAEVLFEFDGVRRDTPPSRQTGQEVTGTISSRTSGGGGLGTDFECTGGLQPVVSTLDASYGRLQGCSGQDANHGHSHLVTAFGGNNQSGPIDLATARNACSSSGRLDFESETFLVQPAPIAFDSRQDCVSSTELFGALGSSSPQAQAVCFSSKDHGADATVELAPTMRAMGHRGSHANGGGQLAVCIHADAVSRTGDALTPSADAEGRVRLRNPGLGIIDDGTTYNLMATGQPHAVCITGDITNTLKAEGFDASEDGTGRGQPIVAHAIQAGALRTNPNSGPDGVGVQADVAYTLEARSEVQCAQMGMAVRRLTPRECERLQGFPDDYTLIPGQLKHISPEKLDRDYIKYLERGGVLTFEQCCNAAADGPRYKALGNSWCVFNVRWIGRRIDAALAKSLQNKLENVA